MIGKEQERPPQMIVIYDQLKRAKMFKDTTLGPVKLSEEERAERLIRNEPTAIAISEFPIVQEQLGILGQRIDFIRDWLWEHGQDFTHHPDIKEWTDSRSVDELKRFYWYEDGQIEITADMEKPKLEEGFRLLVNVGTNTDLIEIVFDFKDRFELTFGPVDDEDLADNPYKSSIRPLVEMIQEEFGITTFYLDSFLQRTVGVS